LSPSKKVVFSIKTGICFAANCSNYGARFMAAIPATVTTTVLSLGYKSQRRNRLQRWGKTRGERQRRKKGGERAAPALPTPSLPHHLLRPAATAILHHNRTNTAQRKGGEERKNNETVRGR